MTVKAAYLVPGSPLPYAQGDNPPWRPFVDGFAAAAESLGASGAETLVVYSTQWLAVLDQLWLTRPHSAGVHVDENWHEFGELPFDVHSDTELTNAVIESTPAINIRSKGVDYDGFPIDTGTIVTNNLLNGEAGLPLCVTSNNLYHDWDMTYALGQVVAKSAAAMNRNIAVVGVGGLSGSFFRNTIDIAEDHVAEKSDDEWNQRMLALLEDGDCEQIIAAVPDFAQTARVDMGFKHCAFILGALGSSYQSAKIHAYGPLYGTGGAIVEFEP